MADSKLAEDFVSGRPEAGRRPVPGSIAARWLELAPGVDDDPEKDDDEDDADDENEVDDEDVDDEAQDDDDEDDDVADAP